MQWHLKHSHLIVNCKHIFFFPSADITDNRCGLFSQFKPKWHDISWREIVRVFLRTQDWTAKKMRLKHRVYKPIPMSPGSGVWICGMRLRQSILSLKSKQKTKQINPLRFSSRLETMTQRFLYCLGKTGNSFIHFWDAFTDCTYTQIKGRWVYPLTEASWQRIIVAYAIITFC